MFAEPLLSTLLGLTPRILTIALWGWYFYDLRCISWETEALKRLWSWTAGGGAGTRSQQATRLSMCLAFYHSGWGPREAEAMPGWVDGGCSGDLGMGTWVLQNPTWEMLHGVIEQFSPHNNVAS